MIMLYVGPAAIAGMVNAHNMTSESSKATSFFILFMFG